MSGILSKIKDVVSKTKLDFDIDADTRKDIIDLVKENTKQYRQKYNEYFVKITKKLEEKKIEFDFEKVDKESKRRAGGETLKDDLRESITPEIIQKVSSDFPEEEKKRMLTQKAAEIAIGNMINGAVDRVVDLTTEAQKQKTEKKEKETKN